MSFATFGEGMGPIYLDNVFCLGNETRLTDCRHQDVGSHNCLHIEDAGVECLGEYTNACHTSTHTMSYII